MERDHFKERLPVKNRAGVANWFLSPIRSGLSDPKAIADRVLNDCLNRHCYPASLVTSLIFQYRDEAEAYAALLVEQESLPKFERRAERGRRNRMRKNSPTPNQSYVISRAGSGIPLNRVDAHDQISQIKNSMSLAEAAMAFVSNDDE